MTQPPSLPSTRDQEASSDDERARDMEEVLSGEYELQLTWMRATGKTREEARAAFREAREHAVAKLVRDAMVESELKRTGANCIYEEFRFPVDLRARLKGTTGRHHATGCPLRED